MHNDITNFNIDFDTQEINFHIQWDLLFLLFTHIRDSPETELGELQIQIGNISEIKNNYTKHEQT